MRIQFYTYFKNKNIIKVHGEKHSIKFLTIKEADKWLKFFQNNYQSSALKAKIDKKWHKNIDKWLFNNNIPNITPDSKKSQFKYWVNKKEYDFIIDLLNNYILSDELAEKTGYTSGYITNLARNNVLTLHHFFAGKYWFHKSEIINLKIRYKKLYE